MTTFSLSRRTVLAALATCATPALAQKKSPAAQPESDHGWYGLRGDDGKPFPNLRIPNELANQVRRLPGLIRVGSETPDVTIYVFTDYNCPWCRKAARELDHLVQTDADLQLGLINNPVLSPASREAALVEMAVIKIYGRKDAYALQLAGLTASGVVNGERLLDIAATQGLDRPLLAKAVADDAELRHALGRQTNLAASMTFTVTPSFLIGSAGVTGYPGPKATESMIAAMRKCELIACK